MRHRNTRIAQKPRSLPCRQVLAAPAYNAADMGVEDMNMLQRLRFTSDFYYEMADREMKKRGRVDTRLVFELMQAGAMIASKLAPYVHPKVVAMQLDLKEPPRPSLDLKKLSDEDLQIFESLVKKCQPPKLDEVQEHTPDEYLLFRKPSA
jgi:hypothetical protein